MRSTVLRVIATVSMFPVLLILLLYYGRSTGRPPPALPLPLKEQTQDKILMAESQKVSTIPALIRPYLFFKVITEQLSQNTVKYFQLCYFSALWNLSIVEPFIYHDHEFLTSLPPISNNMLPLFELYNVTAVEQRLTECFKPNLPKEKQKEFKIHKLDEALIHSPREILIVRFMEQRWSKKAGWSCCECDGMSSKTKKATLAALNTRVRKVERRAKELHGEDYTFRIWRTLCIDALSGVPFSFKNASNCIQKQLDEKRKDGSQGVSVVIEVWKKVVSGYSNWYYYCPEFTFNKRNCPKKALTHTPIVLSTADFMKKHLNLTENFIGVYARTERLALEEGNAPGTLKKCFQQLLTALNTSQALYNISLSNVVLVHDAGKYGSNTFGYGYSKGAMPRAKKLLEMFKAHKIRTVYYDPEVRKDLPQHRAFVAAVEQEFLSRSYILITMGGGGFMSNVKQRHGDKRVHGICRVGR